MTYGSGDHGLWEHRQSHLRYKGLNEHIQDNETAHVVLYISLLLIGIYFVLQRLDYYPLLPLTDLLWNALVYLTPASLVRALDNRAATSMGQETDTRRAYSESRTFAAKSEVLRRIFGLDGTGLVTKLQRARTFSGVGSLLKGPPSHALPGLGNLDNSCYQNSIIQGLAALPSLPGFLQKIEIDDDQDSGISMTTALGEIISELNDTENAGRRLWTPAVLKNMSSWTQQDAQEYFSKIIDDLEKEVVRNRGNKKTHEGLRDVKNLQSSSRARSDETQVASAAATAKHSPELPLAAGQIPDNPLEGLLAQRVGCLRCGYVEGLSLIPFNCITLPLENAFRLSYSLAECLDKYTDLENIEGVDCGRCTLLQQKEQLSRILSSEQSAGADALLESVKARLNAVQDALEKDDYSEPTITKKCAVPKKQRVSSTKTRQAVISRCPDSLVLHVNRSVFDEATFAMTKNNARVTFPPTLDLSSWCLGRVSYAESTISEDEAEQTWSTDPQVSLLAGSAQQVNVPTRQSTKGFEYNLRAIIIHQGRHENGHYVCYRQDPLDPDQWWRLSDENVYSVSREQVLGADGVYMLFYDRTELEAETFEEVELFPSGDPATSQVNDEAIASIEDGVDEEQDVAVEDEPLVSRATISPEASDLGLARQSNPPNPQTDNELSGAVAEVTEHLADTTISSAGEGSKQIIKGKDLPGRDSAQPVLPPMRTAGARKKRGKKGKQRGMAEMSNMVVAN